MKGESRQRGTRKNTKEEGNHKEKEGAGSE